MSKAMTKKHFIQLANYLKDPEPYCEPFTQKQLEHLANFCHSVNPAFKTIRWLDYINGKCDSNGGKR
jgi:hypothetical protein